MFQPDPKCYVLITGASSGIGEGLAREFARRGQPLILTARRRDRLKALARELSSQTRVEWVAADLNDPSGPGRLAAACKKKKWRVMGLANNAGLGFNKSFSKLSANEIGRMMQVNMSALVELTRLFLPQIRRSGNGFVLNLASTAAFQPVPYFSVYAASKAFVVSFSEALHEELRREGVQVCCLCPGPVATEFQQVAGMSPRFFARSQSVDDVVRAAMRLLAGRGAIAWTSWFQRIFSAVSEATPRGARRRIAAGLMKWSGAE
ncbi:MAG: SDR family oxidoreductase [Methylacidiphilales bacterium]|nr:SDR family oxidoreductase [Candidatus Methylacidiphilales bacterium]